jgi:tryptophan-rich sensory protein
MKLVMKNFIKLASSIAICFLAAGIGSIFTVSAIPSWYATLVKPSFSPPNYLFGPVWTILYIMMGISLYIIWNKGIKNKNVKAALYIFGIQLILNTIWSPVFFGAHALFLALIIIIALWFYIVKTIKAFAKIDKLASYLLYPYLAWVSFASILNFSVWFLNR